MKKWIIFEQKKR